MPTRAWLSRWVFRWTRKGRATRRLVEDFGIKEGDAFQLVASVEDDAAEIARKALEARRANELQGDYA